MNFIDDMIYKYIFFMSGHWFNIHLVSEWIELKKILFIKLFKTLWC